ncbi:MAG: ribosome assembly cofactor RimP [Muribaculaceae bacterium]|jgi:ribosome maturation factor RimP|nr:ribosome assembly cofactor RimP [Muribaculaceae bacterium]
MIDRTAVADVVNKALEGSNAFLVDVSVSADNCIVVEIDSTDDISIDQCANLTRTVEANFDRDVEDYELEVGSAGLTSPFRVKGQYLKNIGNEVEILTAAGKKEHGTLKAAGDDNFTVTISRKVKPEGAKRPVLVDEDVTFAYTDVKYTKYLMQF